MPVVADGSPLAFPCDFPIKVMGRKEPRFVHSVTGIVRKHALRAALLPLVSYLGPACAGLITGSLVVEQIFNLPGLGKFFVISAMQRDYTVVMGMVIFYAALILVLNLIADLLYAALDPRVKLA